MNETMEILEQALTDANFRKLLAIPNRRVHKFVAEAIQLLSLGVKKPHLLIPIILSTLMVFMTKPETKRARFTLFLRARVWESNLLK